MTPEKRSGAGDRRPFSTEQAGQASTPDESLDSVAQTNFIDDGGSQEQVQV